MSHDPISLAHFQPLPVRAPFHFSPHPFTLNPSHLSHHISPVSYHIQTCLPHLTTLTPRWLCNYTISLPFLYLISPILPPSPTWFSPHLITPFLIPLTYAYLISPPLPHLTPLTLLICLPTFILLVLPYAHCKYYYLRLSLLLSCWDLQFTTTTT